MKHGFESKCFARDVIENVVSTVVSGRLARLVDCGYIRSVGLPKLVVSG